MSFESFHLHPELASALKTLAFAVPTPIQRQAIPKALEGRDVLGLAQTGTGKTAAFALPILQRLLPGARRRVRALVLAPTRELAEQIRQAFGQMGQRTSLRAAAVYGGVGMAPQIQALRGGAEVIVACPGRLLDHVDRGHVDFSSLEVLVIDEADQMFDMGFLPSIRRILKLLPARRQTLLFSATMPDDIRHLAQECLSQPAVVQVDHTRPLTTVSHALYPVNEHLKTALVLELLRPAHMESVLIFTRTKHRAKRLGLKLKAAGFKAASLQGNLSQNQRQAALGGFRDGRFSILVATDIAARGIDVSQITHVINLDIPNTPEAYTHRIGRTGRAASTGDAFTLVTHADAAMVAAIERRLGRKIERRRLAGFNYDQPAPQPAAQSLRHRGTGPAHPPRNARRTRAWK
ncbi:MAG TPA: RNA helicase [Elusimicrobia bacterium]|nr:RNA helicase [Elusimicrobiota bacterium]HBT60591.1 RNA helicase [Elusimicrobiota bacterium]